MILQNKTYVQAYKNFRCVKGNDMKLDVRRMLFIPFVSVISFPIKMVNKLKLSSQNLYIRDTITTISKAMLN